MRVLKILGIAVGALLAALAALLLAVYLFFDPNAHKERITAAVKQATGRELSLPGRLSLAVFPWVAIETGAASLGNPPGFGSGPFLTLQHARLSVKLLPLLRKQLQIGRIEIDGLDLRLKEDARGKGNWEDWGSKAAGPASERGGTTAGLDLAGIAITNGRIAFQDMVADHVMLTLGHVAPGVSFPVMLSTSFTTAAGAKPMPLQLAGKLALDPDHQRYQFRDFQLKGSVQPAGATQPVSWSFATPAADVDLAAQTLAQTHFTATAGEAKLQGQISGRKLIDAPALDGSFALAQLAPRELLRQFGVAAPKTRDSGVLARFNAQGAYAWQGGVARFTALQLVLDDSRLSGSFAYDTRNGGMDFALGLDQIDLDRYQPPPAAPAKPAAPPAGPGEPIELPVDLLKPLLAHGSFKVGAVKAGGAHLTNLSAGINIGGAVARFAPLQAELYGGRYSGDIGMDMRPAQPRITMDEHMAGIDIARLMKDFADSSLLSGKGNLDVKLAASGSSGDALVRTLTGSASLDLQKGAVEGFDIWYAIGQAQSLLKNRTLSGAPDNKRTSFDAFKASAELVNGIATSKDLIIASQLLRITGAGVVNLISHELDYAVTATVLKAPAGADADIASLQKVAIPVKITGTFTDPKVRPDLGGIAKAQVQKLVEQHKDEVQQKVQSKAKDVLKGLLGGKKRKGSGQQPAPTGQ